MSAYEAEGIILMRRGVEVLEQIRDSLVTEPCPDCARAKKIAQRVEAHIAKGREISDSAPDYDDLEGMLS